MYVAATVVFGLRLFSWYAATISPAAIRAARDRPKKSTGGFFCNLIESANMSRGIAL
jgi:hypothetical protein